MQHAEQSFARSVISKSTWNVRKTKEKKHFKKLEKI